MNTQGTAAGRKARLGRTLVVLCLAGVLGACATTPPEAEPISHYPDPIESFNRGSYSVHDAADRRLLRPAARAYESAAPGPVRSAVGNFFSNLGTPAMVANSLLQGRVSEAVDHTGRFVLNSTVGVLGLMDVATHAGLEPPEQDFGKTLAGWGVPSGPYIFVPLLGPTNLRDGMGTLVDTLAHPLTYTGNLVVRGSLLTLYGLDLRAGLLPLDSNIAQATDPYAFIRNAYTQRRKFVIHEGSPPADALYDLYDMYDLDDLDDLD